MAWGIVILLIAVLAYAWSQGGLVSDLTARLTEAIARAEGFFHPSGTALPQRINNPGNLKVGDVGMGTVNGKTIFATAADGWAALGRQVDIILSGRSLYYSPNMTIREIARIYTGGDNPEAWANTVASSLGVSPDTRISELS